MSGKLLTALLVLLVALGVVVAKASMAAPGADALNCGSLPPEALTTLPAPFDRWAMLDCLPSGQVLRQGEGWIWRYPASFTTQVVIAAYMAEAPAANSAPVFSRTETSVAEGSEARALEDRLRRELASYPLAPSDGSAPGAGPPAAIYTLLAVTDLGQFLELHVVYRSDRNMWAVVCAPDCRPENVFMIYRQE